MTEKRFVFFGLFLMVAGFGSGLLTGYMKAQAMDTDQTRREAGDRCYPGHMTACKKEAQNLGPNSGGAQGQFPSDSIVVNGITYYPRPCGARE